MEAALDAGAVPAVSTIEGTKQVSTPHVEVMNCLPSDARQHPKLAANDNGALALAA